MERIVNEDNTTVTLSLYEFEKMEYELERVTELARNKSVLFYYKSYPVYSHHNPDYILYTSEKEVFEEINKIHKNNMNDLESYYEGKIKRYETRTASFSHQMRSFNNLVDDYMKLVDTNKELRSMNVFQFLKWKFSRRAK